MTDAQTPAYDAFITQLDHNLNTAGASDALQTAVTAGVIADVMTAVRALCADAAGKAKLLFLGSPPGTILRNKNTGVSATRVISPAGIPLWQVSNPADGSKWETHEPVLEPEADWVCIYNPEAAG